MTVLTALVVVLAVFLVIRVLRQFTLADILQSLARLSPTRLALAGLFTAASYGALTFFDVLGIRYAGKRLPYPRVALASFTALSIGHTAGLAPLSSGAIRYRFYARWGLSLGEIGLVVIFSAVSVGIGETAIAALALLAEPTLAAPTIGITPAATLAIGAACALLLAAYVLLAARVSRPIRIFGLGFRFPSWPLAAGQILAGGANYAFVVAALHQALAAGTASYATVATAYILGSLAAVLSHVPGGLGVLEAVMVSLLPGADVIGALVAFRAIYYLVPLALGTLVLLVAEGGRQIGGRRVKARASGAIDAASRRS